ncbi:MAG: hypothetical protein A2V72_00035 [Candidatus Nealsonbacteria bacterium RBG_13_37_56]|uniref:Uncharacterized protein n=1 Tax=Candidatus Nealsonbacteria bacterium RBG_13_37_56 TaxID=1801661 RepID=A0A1G2DXA7_9BACT|nr:MAG: hypothetical protein A2V72_00035 [Candidatus Nealsonbacteria bacterium RBG_13_37_56]
MAIMRTKEGREKFSGLVERSTKLKNGIHDIFVEEVFTVGQRSLCQPEVAIIRDGQGRILLIPEDMKCDGRNRLVSRWNLKKEMSLQIAVTDNEISEVLIGGG